MAEITQMPTFFGFEQAVAWDYLLERGYNPEEFNTEESIKDWVVRIRGKIGAFYAELAWPRHLWMRWEFFPGRHINGTHRFALIRHGTTEDLFRELDSDQLWSAILTADEYELWHALTPESRATTWLTRQRPNP